MKSYISEVFKHLAVSVVVLLFLSAHLCYGGTMLMTTDGQSGSNNSKAISLGHIVTTASLSAIAGMTPADLAAFDAVWINPDLSASGYNTLRSVVAGGGSLEQYVSAGGTIVLNVAGNSGSQNDIAPGGIDYDRTTTHNSETFAAPTHPFLTGSGYGGHVLTTSDFSGWGSTDHGNLNNIVGGALTILNNTDGPSFVEYSWGSGIVIVNTLTFGWGGGGGQGNPQDNVINYANSVVGAGLAVSPSTGLYSTGDRGGPFTPSSADYLLTNNSDDILGWSAVADVIWLDVQPGAGTLAVGASTTVQVRINSSAGSLPTGSHRGSVIFTDLNSAATQERLVTLQVGIKSILAFTQYADLSQEYPNTLAAIDTYGGVYTVTTLSDYSQLDAMLPGHNVLLIPEMEGANSTQLYDIGVAWRSTLQDFVNNGGVVIQCDAGSRYGILTGSELMAISSSTNTSGGTLNVVAPEDPVAEGVSATYVSPNATFSYDTSETEVIVEYAGRPVVINKELGQGQVVLIGHDYYDSNPDADRIVANAVFNLPVIRDDLRLTPAVGFTASGTQGGPFTPPSQTYQLDNTGDSFLTWTATEVENWLDITPASGFLAAGASVNVEVAISPNADGLPPGTYDDNVVFTNKTTGVSRICDVILEITRKQHKKLLAADGYDGDIFGSSVSIDGNYAIVGAYQDDDMGSDSGSAYIFYYNGSEWIQQAKLTASDGYSYDFFGYSVSIAGDYAIVGAYTDDDGGSSSGSAYIFHRSGSIWSQQSKLTASDAYSGDRFGISVRIDGDNAIVGAYFDDDNGSNSGSVYIFHRSGSLWTQQAKFTALDGDANDRFGYSVSIAGDYAIIGAFGDDDGGSDSGSAYIFHRSGSIWSQQSKLTASDAYSSDRFGVSVRIDGDNAIVGAYQDDDVYADSGSAYIFERTGSVWSQTAKLTASDPGAVDRFGFAVSIKGEYAIVGAYWDDDNGADSGSAYLFQKPVGGWADATETIKQVPEGDASGDDFGISVDVSDGWSLIGARYDDDNGSDSGSAYVFGDTDPFRVSAIIPPDTFNVSGGEEGPFVPSSKEYRVTNKGKTTFTWTADSGREWLDVTPAGGTLDPNTSVIVELSINNLANELSEGIYGGIVAFTNDISNTTVSKRAVLEVISVPGKIEVIDSIPEPNMPFGDVIVGLVRNEQVTVTNLASNPRHELIVEDIRYYFDGMSAPPTVITLDLPEGGPPWIVGAGESIVTDVNFTPAEFIDYRAYLVIESNDANNPTIEIYLSGSGVPEYIEVTPPSGGDVSFSGHFGGPFMPSNASYILTNSGPVAVEWTVQDQDPNWLNFSPSGGTLVPGESVEVIVQPNDIADAKVMGLYPGQIVFVDETTTMTQNFGVSLVVYSEGKIFVDPPGFDLGITQGMIIDKTLTIGNVGDADLSYTLGSNESWLSVSRTDGLIEPGAAHQITVTIEGNLSGGSYSAYLTVNSNSAYNANISIPVEISIYDIDYFTELFEANENDISNLSITFTPDGLKSFYEARVIEASKFPVPTAGHTPLFLGDDDYAEVTLDGLPVSLYGVDYDTFYVGSNGYISFVSGDIGYIENVQEHLRFPRIASLFDDLDPSAGGAVTWKQLADRVVVTFEDVPELAAENSNSFQTEMFYDGRIRVTWLDIGAEDGLVGLSDGNGLTPYFKESDMSGYPECATAAGDINKDLRIDLEDFVILSRAWGQSKQFLFTVRDEFNAVGYDGNNGSANWSGDWTELGESDGPAAGVLQVSDAGAMRIGAKGSGGQFNRSLTRQADLAGATVATLTFDYAVERGNSGSINVEVSPDGGANWYRIASYSHDSPSGSADFDISSWISASTMIRFSVEPFVKIRMFVNIDNVQIEYDPDQSWYSWSGGADIDKDFNVGIGDLLLIVDDWLH